MPDAIRQRLTDFIADAKAKAVDGLTWAEFGEILIDFLRLSIYAYDGVIAMTGAQKKAAVIEGVAALVDALAPFIMPWWLLPALPAVRSLVIALASGAIETLIPLVRAA